LAILSCIPKHKICISGSSAQRASPNIGCQERASDAILRTSFAKLQFSALPAERLGGSFLRRRAAPNKQKIITAFGRPPLPDEPARVAQKRFFSPPLASCSNPEAVFCTFRQR